MKEIIYRVEVTTREQLEQAVETDDFQYIYAPINLLDGNTPDKFRIIAVPPVYLADCEEKCAQRLAELKSFGFEHGLAHTAGHVYLLKKAGFKIHGGFRLNITNSRAMEFYEEQGITDTVLSVELTMSLAKGIRHNVPTGLIAYGKLPLMITRRCPVKDGKPCGGGKYCGGKITDRKGNELEIVCSNTCELLNPDTLILSDRLSDIADFDFAVLRLTCEENVREILDMYLESKKPDGKLTRGLYYRGVE